MHLAKPIAYIVFNRPQHTHVSFDRIRAQRPTDLFVIADGPRPGHATDADRCTEVREIVGQIDWDCRTHLDFAPSNLGLKQRIVSGLNEVFDQVDEAIILEDDCVPHDDFFEFCTSMLDRYADDERIAAVTGDNFQNGQVRGDGSYYFSKYNHCWGWATWARAWRHNDPDMSFWPSWRSSESWRAACPDPVERAYWNRIFDRVAADQISTWDYTWTASTWRNGGLTVTPNANLVANIGFGPDATNTTALQEETGLVAAPLGEIRHPSSSDVDEVADAYVFDHHYGGLALRERRFRNYPKLTVRSIRYRLSQLRARRAR